MRKIKFRAWDKNEEYMTSWEEKFLGITTMILV